MRAVSRGNKGCGEEKTTSTVVVVGYRPSPPTHTHELYTYTNSKISHPFFQEPNVYTYTQYTYTVILSDPPAHLHTHAHPSGNVRDFDVCSVYIGEARRVIVFHTIPPRISFREHARTSLMCRP